MTYSLKITLTPVLSTSIIAVAADAQRIADLLGAAVEFHCNGVACTAKPGGSAGELVRQFGLAQRGSTTTVGGLRVAMS